MRSGHALWPLRTAAAALLSVVPIAASAGTTHAERESSWTPDKGGRPLASPVPYLFDFEVDGLYKAS
jgi:hypothetical protein